MLDALRPLRALAVSIGLAIPLVALTASASALGPGGWDHVGVGATPTTSSLNGNVDALNADVPGSLYVGGAFTTAGGDGNATHIAKWDGTSWSALGPANSLNGDVRAIATSGGKVYVGGEFTNAGGDPNTDFLAVWDGTSWSSPCTAPSGPPITAAVSSLQVVGTKLYVGGSFANGGGLAAADFLVACDLTTGAPSATVASDGDLNGAIYALTADSNGTLYAGGQFINLQGDAAVDHIAAFDGTWHAMGTGPSAGGGSVDSIVRSLKAQGTNVYVGSDALNIASIPQADNVARWNGSSWSAMGSATGGTDGYFASPPGAFLATINGLATSGSDVYATGSFQNENGDPLADQIVRFDGSSWHPVGSNGAGNGPLNASGNAIAVFGGQLYAGGGFTAAGGDNLATGIACYLQCTFPPPQPTKTLSVSVAGTGSGYVGTVGAIRCPGGACSADYPVGSVVNVYAYPDSGSTFSGWSGGGCPPGTGVECTVTMSADQHVTATFTPQATGRRAAALKKCKKKRGRARAICKKKANKLPI